MQLLLPTDYVDHATTLLRKATTRVALLSMVIADHPATHDLIRELEATARRHVNVSVAADIFTYGEVSGSFLPIRYYSNNAKYATRMVKGLREAGVKFHWLGKGRTTILNGRTHSKWLVIDDTVFGFGGVNMYEEGISNTDFMFQLENADLADRLVQEQHRILRADRNSTNYPSASFAISQGTVLIDGGLITKSIIYRRACELALEATHITFVSQYCPTGRLSRIFKSKSSTLYFNAPQQANLLNKVFLRLSLLISGLKSHYTRDNYLHAKFIIFTMPDGTKTAITGSHNFAYTGVLLGTREIALETKDPAIIGQLESFFARHIVD